MPDFDPDAFLKGSPAPAAPAFDPDALIKGDAPASGIPPNGPSAKEKELRKKYLEETMQRGEPGYTERFLDSYTLGAPRPIGGLLRGIQGLGDPNSSFGERWRAGNAAAGDYFDKASENTPGPLGYATDIAGSVASGPVGKVGAGIKALVTGGKVAAKTAGKEALKGAVKEGATLGAIEGANRNAQSVGDAVSGAGAGAAIGGTTAAVVGKGAQYIPKVGKAVAEAVEGNKGTSPEVIREWAKAGYKDLDNAGIKYAQVQGNDLRNGIDNLIATNQYNDIAHKDISGYVKDLLNKTEQPQGFSFSELHNLRSALATEAREGAPTTREAASKINKEIDKFVHGNEPAVNPQNKDIKQIYPLATKRWRAAAMADDVNWTADKAERKAQSKAGVNPDEANRGAFAAISNQVNAPGKYNPYNDEQKQLLATIIAGDKGQNTYRNLGAAAAHPMTKNAVGLGLGAIGWHGGDPLIGVASGLVGRGGAEAGSLMQRGLNRLAANRGAENIDALVRSITQTAPKQLSPEALKALLAQRIAQRGGAAYAARITGPGEPQ